MFNLIVGIELIIHLCIPDRFQYRSDTSAYHRLTGGRHEFSFWEAQCTGKSLFDLNSISDTIMSPIPQVLPL